MEIKHDQIARFLHLLRQNLIAAGVDRTRFDQSVEISLRQLLAPPSADPTFSRQPDDSGLMENSRGIDSLGRILVEFCFMRSTDTPMIWPENSEQDTTARKMFTREYIPRPLMRYFLASVRGAIPQLDNFEADSILLEEENDTHSQRVLHINELLEDFKGPFGEGESAIDWPAIYADPRFQNITLELIRDIRHKIEQFGLEHFLHILENYRQHDPDSKGTNAMQRPFTLNDAKQIDEALIAAESALAHILN